MDPGFQKAAEQVGGPLAGIGGVVGTIGAGLISLKEPCTAGGSSDCLQDSTFIVGLFIDMHFAGAMALGGFLGALVGIIVTLVIAFLQTASNARSDR